MAASVTNLEALLAKIQSDLQQARAEEAAKPKDPASVLQAAVSELDHLTRTDPPNPLAVAVAAAFHALLTALEAQTAQPEVTANA